MEIKIHKEILKNVKSIDEKAKNPKNRVKAAELYLDVAGIVLAPKKANVEYALEQTAKCKKLLDEEFQATLGRDFFTIDRYCLENNLALPERDLYWKAILTEAPYLFDSYLLYLEKKRADSEKFYFPKREQFLKLGIIQGLQDMEDDKLDILSLSLPPGTGKSQPLYSLVLTPNGFIKMGDVKIGTKVIAGNGNISNVIGIYPQGYRDVYEIVLASGAKCRCSDEHLWYVENINQDGEVRKLSSFLNDYDGLYIPTKNLNHFESIEEINYVGKEECQCIMIDDECHLYITDDHIITHNTTIEKFFASWIIGRHPKDYSLFFSHSEDITRMFYDGVLDICSNDDEYTWYTIFPEVRLQKTDAKRLQINFDRPKPFANMQCTSVGSKNAGKVRCNRYLYCDDLIGGIEEALNKATLDKLWRIYGTDARQRKLNEQVKEIHIATRWSVHDVIGRLKMVYDGNDRSRFIAVPDIDPKTGKSNFDYKYNGMSVKFFNDQALTMDDVTYRCLYKNEPIEREGLLYHEDDVRRYLSLPIREPDAILSICDVKNKGTDFMFLPVMYQYDDDYYLVDCICDDSSDYGVQYERLSNILVNHNVQQCQFESNTGGDRVSFEVNKLVESKGGRCNITNKPTETNKETKIIVNSDWVKKHVLFKDKTMYSPKEDYGVMMNWLMTYSVVGRNPHDDVPDGLAMFSLFVTGGPKKATVEAAFNPFRRRY